jgi:RNA polymerase sigma-70 factor (ECF subfamily)
MNHEAAESDLIRQAVAGDRRALSQLLLQHYDQLSRHVAQRLSDEVQSVWFVEDVLQETFYKAAQALRGFEDRGAGSFGAWLKTIASNLIKDAQKRRRRERRAPGLAADSSLTSLVDRIAGDTTSPSRQVRRADSISHLRAALASLPPEQREVIQRYYLRDESLDEIAVAMDRSRDAIRGICYRARCNLRSIMGHSSQFLSG